jgi:phosphatidylinositol alpha-1,6-mannosyltransferase
MWHLDLLKLLPFLRQPPQRLILFLHGIEAWREQSPAIQSQLPHVDLFLNNSAHTWRRFVDFQPKLANSQQQIVHLGLGTPLTFSEPPAQEPCALMLGRMVSSENYKGHQEMIAIWPKVCRRVPQAKLWIAGEGDLKPLLERQVIALGLSQSVVFWGEVTEAFKQQLLARSRCLALPSRAEGFGLVYLEALRLGRPCLVSTKDAGQEVVNPPEAGLAADPDCEDDLVESMCRLLSMSPEWHAWSVQARQRYETNFTAGHFQTRLLDALGLTE